MALDLSSRLGIETFGFRNFPRPAQVAELTKACGVDTVELCASHFDPADRRAQADASAVLKELANGGIKIATFFSFHPFGEDESNDRKVFEFAQLAGLQTVVGDIAPGRLAQANRAATEHGVRIAIHNHGRKHRHGSVQALAEIFDETSSSIGLCLDTGWALDSGEDPVEFARTFQSRLYGLHIKDFVFDRAGRPEDVVAGSGVLDLNGLNRFLIETGYEGCYVLEYEGDPDDPVPATRKCVQAIKASLSRLGG